MAEGPIITITHSLLEGTMHVSVAPDVSEEDMERIGYLIRVGLLALAEVLSDGLAHREEKVKPKSNPTPSIPDVDKSYS